MSIAGTVWKPIGPSPIDAGQRNDNGVVTAIAVHPSNPDVVYLGTGGGGLWQTRDGGAAWTPLFDRQLSLSIGEASAIAIDPNDAAVIYVGVNGRIFGGSFSGFVDSSGGLGLYKSVDAGGSWVRVGSGFPDGNTGNATQFDWQWIYEIVVDPADSNIVYLASHTGVYRSTDAGLNWTQGTNATGDAQSLELDVSSPAGARVLYAGIGGAGVIRSVDGGANWTSVLDGTTPAVSSLGSAFGKVVVGLAPPASPPNPAGVQVIYAALAGGTPDPLGLFLSTDAGATWTQQAATGMPGNTQGGYSFDMGIDPASPGDGANDILYVGCVGQARSTDAGATFTGLANLHADTHTWAFARPLGGGPTVVYSGNDGGVYRSTDNGATWTAVNSGRLQTCLFYNIDSRPDATASVVVGTLQDNGVLSTSGAAGPTWRATSGGDGWDAVYDGDIDGQVYSSSGVFAPPATRIFRSTDDGVTWSADITPWGTTSDQGPYIASLATDPGAAGIVYASGRQNLWQSRDSGDNWRIILSVGGPGDITVAPANGNNVAIAVNSRVWLSTNALAATVGSPGGVTFTEITRNLPGRNVQRVEFDPNDPAALFVVLGGFDGFGLNQQGHVFRTTVTATEWTDISPDLDLPHGAIALDGTTVPTTIYAGTDLGVIRSVDLGLSWTVVDDIRFPRVPVIDLSLNQAAGTLRAATYGRGVFELVKPRGPAITAHLENGLDFGTVCGGPNDLALTLTNVGTSDLRVDSVQPLVGSANFSVLPFPGTPVVIQPGESLEFTVRYTGSQPGSEAAVIRVVSNDPAAPVFDVIASARVARPALDLLYPPGGFLGTTCPGTILDGDLVINNSGPCDLIITHIASDSAEILVDTVASFPLTIGPGDSLAVGIRYAPSSYGTHHGTITIYGAGWKDVWTIRVRGTAPAPRLVTVIADSGDFGRVCVDAFVDRPLTLQNSGCCPLTIFDVGSDSPEFQIPAVVAFPATIGAGDSLVLPVRFQPTSFGPKFGTITIVSDDPISPHAVPVSGYAPSGILTVTGSTQFGAVEFGVRVQQVVTICNTGECALHVTRVAFRPLCGCEGEYDESGCGCGDTPATTDCCDQRCSHFKLINNPFPATLRPGSCLSLPIEYTPRCNPPRCCEIEIVSDDPNTPVKVLYVNGRLRRTLASALKCWGAAELREMLEAGS